MFDRIKEDIDSVFARDPAARTRLEVLLNYPGLHAALAHRWAHSLWLANWKGLARLISTLSRFWTGIEIHPGAQIGRRFFIDHGMGVVIGETAEIGDDVTLYHGVTLGGTSWNPGKRHPTLEDGVVVGAGAKVLGPIIIGQGARIGSNAVVVKAVPAGASVVGPAGRIIPRREDGVAPSVQEEQEKARRDFAAKIGFQAYAANPDLPDPILDAMRDLLDHMQATEQRMDRFCANLKEVGINVCDQKPEALRAETLATVNATDSVPNLHDVKSEFAARNDDVSAPAVSAAPTSKAASNDR